MNRRAFVTGLGAVLTVPLAAKAQQAGKVYRVGYLTVPSRETAHGVADRFEAALGDLGWIAGKNVSTSNAFAS